MFDRKRANEEVLSVIFPLAKFEIRQYVCMFLEHCTYIYNTKSLMYERFWTIIC